MAARGRPPTRHEGGLQRGRLRRVHSGRRIARRAWRRGHGARPRAAQRQRLPAVPADARRQGALHGRRSEGDGWWPAAPGAAGDGRLPRLAVRVLHARLRDVALVGLRATQRLRQPPRPSTARRRAVGQPVSLHRLPADPRRRAANVRAAAGRPRHGTDRRGAAVAAVPPRSGPRRWRALPRATHAGRTRHAARRAPGRQDPGRVHRHGPVGDQGAARPGRADLRRRGGRIEAHRAARRRAVHRRRSLARGRLAGAGGAMALARGGVAALRVAADPPRRNDGRQRRERLADRRRGASADGARCADRAAPGAAPARDAAARVLPGLHEEPPRTGRVRAGPHGAGAATGLAGAGVQDIEAIRLRHLGRLRRAGDQARWRHGERRALRLRRHGSDRATRRACRGRRSRHAVEPDDTGRRPAGAGRGLRATVRHARQRRLPNAGGEEPAAALLAGNARDGPFARQRAECLERDGARRRQGDIA